jgi:multimeric flavodoxin WrbA
MRKMIIINGSPRGGGSSSAISDAVAENASGKGFACERIDLGELRISHCRGCMGCKSTGRCAIDDDMTPLYGKVQDADAVMFSVPVYFGAETGLLKNFIDRLYALIDVRDGVMTARYRQYRRNGHRERIIFKCILMEWNVMVWTEFICIQWHL